MWGDRALFLQVTSPIIPDCSRLSRSNSLVRRRSDLSLNAIQIQNAANRSPKTVIIPPEQIMDMTDVAMAIAWSQNSIFSSMGKARSRLNIFSYKRGGQLRA
jgi:hypothetical protein